MCRYYPDRRQADAAEGAAGDAAAEAGHARKTAAALNADELLKQAEDDAHVEDVSRWGKGGEKAGHTAKKLPMSRLHGGCYACSCM